jgi:phenylpropionate dioxygenase-like ring-hydroxylating dioxygenase large terminal subunit
MLVTRQPVFRRFWYATVPVASLAEGPKPFTLLGEPIVLFLDREGKPACLEDRCCHRTAKLSKGWLRDGNIVCGYHGWEYDRDGKLVNIPQFPFEQAIPDARARSFRAVERYGYVFVALDDPIAEIPAFPEDKDPSYRRIHQFYERWETSSLRLMENSFDNAHFAFVHKATFGDINQPKPEKYAIVETDWGFEAETIVTVRNPPHAARITGTGEPTTKRHMHNKWFMPFCRRLDMVYPSGLRHIIFNCATPIHDGTIQVVQILFRNDREEDCSAAELIAWDAAIIAEDREILESTDPDAIVDMGRKIEMHMPSDRPGMLMRKRLLALLEAHGEIEVPRHPAAAPAPIRSAAE